MSDKKIDLNEVNNQVNNASAQARQNLELMGAFYQDRLNWQRSKEMFEAQKDFQREIMRYNSPTAQIERLKRAGINPYIAYGQGSVENTATASPGVNEFNGSNIAQAFGNYARHGLEQALLRSQIANVDADTEQKKASAGNLSSMTTLNEITAQNLDDKQKAEIANLDTDISLKMSSINMNDSNTERNKKEIEHIDQIIKESVSRIKVNEEEAKRISVDAKCKAIYVGLEKDRVALEKINTKLRERGLELTAQGIQIDKDRFLLDKEKWKTNEAAILKDLELRQILQDHNIALDWAEFTENTIKDVADVTIDALTLGLSKIGRSDVRETYRTSGRLPNGDSYEQSVERYRRPHDK